MENALGGYATIVILIGLAILIVLGITLVWSIHRISVRTKAIREDLKDARAAMVVMRAELGSLAQRHEDEFRASPRGADRSR